MDSPNILWYCTDQQRFDTIAALGNPQVQTPALDSLVAEGTAFTHAYCQSPICTPSRSSFMTGLYPSRLHSTRNGNGSFPCWNGAGNPVSAGHRASAAHAPLISKLIANAGYDCGMIGKFHLQSSGHRTEPRLDDGYRYWKFSHAPRDDWPPGEHDYADWVRQQGGDLDALRESTDRVPAELHQTTWATTRAIEFLEQSRESPWFLTVNIYDPHPPFIPPREYFERFDVSSMPGPYFRESDRQQQLQLADIDFQPQMRFPSPDEAKMIQAQYYAMIALIDDQFARLLAHLEATGQRENTVIVFTSDHGEALGDHGLVQKGCRFYEGLVRVPLIFAGPDVQCGSRSDALVELLDMSATLLELAGVAVPLYHQGRSLLPILCGQSDPAEHRESVRCEYYDALDPHFVRDSGRASHKADHGSYATMYRDRRYKIVSYHDVGLGELYDLENDPWEFDNLWDDPAHAALKCELLQRNFDATMLASIDVGAPRIAPM